MKSTKGPRVEVKLVGEAVQPDKQNDFTHKSRSLNYVKLFSAKKERNSVWYFHLASPDT